MKAQRDYPRFTITAKGTRWVEQGHPWIYAAEVLREEGAIDNGALADAVNLMIDPGRRGGKSHA